MLHEKNMSGSTDCSADAAERALLSRTSTFVSKPVPVPGGGAVDLSTLDPAALINSVAHETRFAIESAAEFNARWRAALRERFEAQGAGGELDAWLATGLSNGRPLKLEVMALKPNVGFSVERISVGEIPREIPYAQAWFKVHAHPNIEFEQTLVGALCASSAESPPRHRRAPSSRHRRDATQAPRTTASTFWPRARRK